MVQYTVSRYVCVHLHVHDQVASLCIHTPPTHTTHTHTHTHTQIRRVVSDFGVFIAVCVWVGIDVLADVDTPKLEVPNVFTENFYTSPNRTYLFIAPLGMCVFLEEVLLWPLW